MNKPDNGWTPNLSIQWTWLAWYQSFGWERYEDEKEAAQ